jgi:septal ring factor EnvC (AmiA/AmiB activator)
MCCAEPTQQRKAPKRRTPSDNARSTRRALEHKSLMLKMAADRQLALEEALAYHEHLLASVFAELCSAEQRAEELHQQLADDQHAAALATPRAKHSGM